MTDNSQYLILSSYDDVYAKVGLGPLSSAKNKEYADKHGYSFQCKNEQLKSHYFFHKFMLLSEVLPNYSHVLWIDADAFLVNHSKKIQDFIPDDPEKIFTVSIDQEYLNTGVFIIKNCDLSMELLKKVVEIGSQIIILFRMHLYC